MKIHHLTLDEAIQSVHSTPQGLASQEARRRHLEFGPNRIEEMHGVPLWHRLLKSLTHLFALILWLAAGLAFLADHYDPDSGMSTLGFAIVCVIIINGLFSFWQEYRAERAIAALKKLLPHQVQIYRDGILHTLSVEELVPGDIVMLADGEQVPADCRLLEAFAVRVNNATVTGESFPQSRDERTCNEEDVLHSRNVLLAGTCLVSGQARALVFATGMRTEFGKIARLTQHARATLSPLQKEIVHLSRLITVLSFALGLIFFVIGRAIGITFWSSFVFAIGIIVANVPEGLLPTVTLALAMASQRMARRRALIRHLPAVETLGAATVICTDKTGTLTQNRMAVRRLYLDHRTWTPEELRQDQLVRKHGQCFFETAGFCQTLKRADDGEKKAFFGDPMEVALVALAEDMLPPTCYPRVDEIPFDSDRCRLSTLHRTPDGLRLYVKGSLEALLPLCSHIARGGESHPLQAAHQQLLLSTQSDLASQGLRVLALAHRAVSEPYDRQDLEKGLTLTGLVGLEDPPRPEVPQAVRDCQSAGIKVIMVTGDHPQTALAVARQIGLIRSERPVMITGEHLRRMSATQLQLALNAPEIHFARVTADQKTRVVEALKAKGHIVAVTGDGVNDAPALRQADIGIAMGQSGTDVAREAADVILLDDNFASIVAAVEEGRTVFANMQKFLGYILTHNVAELIPFLAYALFKIPLPLTVMQILAIDLGTDTLPALALGAESPDLAVMRQQPRQRHDRLVSRALLARSYLFLGLVEAAAALAAFFFVLRTGGWHYGMTLPTADVLYRQATTACLSAIIVMQIVNVFLCRSDTSSAFSRLPANRLILLGIVVEMVLIVLIDYSEIGQGLFGTAAIGWQVWCFLIPFALGMLILEEARKLLVRRRIAARGSSLGPVTVPQRKPKEPSPIGLSAQKT